MPFIIPRKISHLQFLALLLSQTISPRGQKRKIRLESFPSWQVFPLKRSHLWDNANNGEGFSGYGWDADAFVFNKIWKNTNIIWISMLSYIFVEIKSNLEIRILPKLILIYFNTSKFKALGSIKHIEVWTKMEEWDCLDCLAGYL